ncbi:MAG TPA: HlyD family efflux transporter periplasmic adaptor subunit, partial [Gemmataceae bacterium]|nr:HlyD family efflux transporter periplasmic adaptor subunit [Gemmataceae bacterium]
MSRKVAVTLLNWALVLTAVAALLGGAYWVHHQARQRRAAEGGDAVQAPRRAANSVVKLGKELAESHGIQDEPAQAVEWAPRMTAYGRVVPNPRATAEIRAVLPGTLRADSEAAWPAIGTRVQTGKRFGWLDVRVGPQERLDLLSKLNEARAREQGAREVVRIQRERVERLSVAGSGVSRAELDAAQTQLAEAETGLGTAKAAVQGWQEALDAIDRQGERSESPWRLRLAAPIDGEVTEVLARPGMAVEAGATVARVVEFRFALVRLELPADLLTAGPPPRVDLTAVAPRPPALDGASNRPEPESPPPTIPATLVGHAPGIDPVSQLAAYWYEVDTTRSAGNPPVSWRPGLFVKADVAVPKAATRRAVTVAGTALLYHQGRVLAFVRVG